MSIYILPIACTIVLAIGLFIYTRKHLTPKSPYKADDEELIDLAIIKAKEADQFKNFLANEAEALQRKKINEREEAEARRATLKENNTVRSKLLDFVNDAAQLEVIYMFLNRNFQLWSKNIGENGLLSLKYLYNVKSYSRSEDVIDITIEIMQGIELKFKLFHPDMPVRINAELVFDWRYTEDLNEQPIAKYDTKIVEQNAYMEYQMYGHTPINAIRNCVRNLFKIESLGLAGHAFYAFGITYGEIRPFLRSDDCDVIFSCDESSGAVERIELKYFREQAHEFNLEEAAYDLYDYDIFYFEELTDYIAPAAYLLMRLDTITIGVLNKRGQTCRGYDTSPFSYISSITSMFKAEYDLTWNKQ